MGSPLELESRLVPRLHLHVKKWSWYVDDTFAYVKNESIDYDLTTLNSFLPNINFTCEIENNIQLPSLDYKWNTSKACICYFLIYH